ncbi:MAG: hypothetical protein ACYC2I_01200 [Elusimicrobiales bacterium]
MTGSSNDRKKALVVFMLLFLVSGGGVFLFFVVQGSNDLIGKGKEFSYGGAAREGVSSFFKYVGLSSSEEGIVSESGKIRAESKGIVLGEPLVPPADVSDWMAPSASKSKAPSTPTSVPRMASGRLSGAGGIGGGGSKSSGGLSRYGEGSGLGNTRIGKGGAGDAGVDKGTLSSLHNAKSALGVGLRSGSASTAKSQWGTAFGEGGGKGGQLSYASGGLVKLDTIKKGEVGSLKTSYMKKPEVPEAGAFERDKEAEGKDAGIQAAKEAAKEAAEAAAKKAAIQAGLQAAANGVSGTGSDPNSRGGTNTGGDTTTADGTPVPPGVLTTLKSGFCSNDCSNAGGVVSDTNATVTPGANGNYNVTYLGSVTKDGVTTPNVEVWELDKNGAVIKQVR